MLTLERDFGTGWLARAFAEADSRLKRLEGRIDRGGSLPLVNTVEQAAGLTAY